MTILEWESGAPPLNLTLALLLPYPLLVHLAVVWNEPLLEWLALVLLCAIPQWQGLRPGRRRSRRQLATPEPASRA